MALVQPKLHVKPQSGVWFVHWANKDWYFFVDEDRSRHAWLDPKSTHPGAYVRWAEWKSSKLAKRAAARSSAPITVARLAERFFEQLANDAKTDEAAYYRTHLRRFVATLGHVRVDQIDEAALNAFNQTLRTVQSKRGTPLGAKTRSHDIKAVKTLWRFGCSPVNGRICPPLQLDLIKPDRVRKGDPQPVPAAEIRARLLTLSSTHPDLATWLLANYLTGARPSEVVRMAYGQHKLRTIYADTHGPAIADGYAELVEHKMANRTEHSRFIPLSCEALVCVKSLRPLPGLRASTHDAQNNLRVRQLQDHYAKACASVGLPRWPSRMRDSAATHLLELGIAQGTVDLCLGHEPKGQLGSYGTPSLRLLRETISRLERPSPADR